MIKCEKCPNSDREQFMKRCVGDCNRNLCTNCQLLCRKCHNNITCNKCNINTEQHPKCAECEQ